MSIFKLKMLNFIFGTTVTAIFMAINWRFIEKLVKFIKSTLQSVKNSVLIPKNKVFLWHFGQIRLYFAVLTSKTWTKSLITIVKHLKQSTRYYRSTYVIQIYSNFRVGWNWHFLAIFGYFWDWKCYQMIGNINHTLEVIQN